MNIYILIKLRAVITANLVINYSQKFASSQEYFHLRKSIFKFIFH